MATALWVGVGTNTNVTKFRWISKVSYTAHNEARQAGIVTRRGKELPVWALHLLLTLVTLGYLPFWAGQVILEYRTRQRLVYATDDQDQLLWADMSVQPLEWQLFEQNPPPKHARVLER